MIRPCFLLLFVLAALVSPAQKVRFTCLECEISDSAKRVIQQMAANEFEYYKSVFGEKKDPTVPVTIYGNFGRFMNTQRGTPHCGRSKQGYFSPKTKTVAVYKDFDFVHTCFHEISHALLNYFCPENPTWLTEGLATYFQFSNVDSTGKVVTYAHPVVKRNAYGILYYHLCSPAMLVTHSYRRFHRFKKHEFIHYTLSWGIIYYLVKTQPETLESIMRDICGRKGSVTAINNEYRGGMQGLEDDMRAFYKPDDINNG